MNPNEYAMWIQQNKDSKTNDKTTDEKADCRTQESNQISQQYSFRINNKETERILKDVLKYNYQYKEKPKIYSLNKYLFCIHFL